MRRAASANALGLAYALTPAHDSIRNVFSRSHAHCFPPLRSSRCQPSRALDLSLNRLYHTPYAAPVHSHILQVVVQDLDQAFNAFFRRVQVGETPGYPRFKSRDRFQSFGPKEYRNGSKLEGGT